MKYLFVIIASITIQSRSFAQQLPAKGLNVADLAPALAPYKWVLGGPVKNFEKGKIYVVELGATWCTPCAAAIPELSALADRYQSEVTVISLFVMENNREPVTTRNPKYVENVERYVQKRAASIRYHVAVDGPEKKIEREWITSGNRVGVPHVFVIDRQGVIAWIGNSVKAVPEVIEKIKKADYAIERMLEEKKTAEKTTVSFDDKELLLINGNGGEDHDFLFRSMLTRYDGTIRNPYPDYIDSFHWLDDPEFVTYKDRLQVVGRSIGNLYFLAYADTLSVDPRSRNSVTREFPDTIKWPHMKTSYGKYWHEPIIEVANPEPFQWDRKSKQNRYNYSLKVPAGLGTARTLQNILRRDLQGYFGYNAMVESRRMPYWKVILVNQKLAHEKLKPTQQGGKFDIQDNESVLSFINGNMRDIVLFLGSNYGYIPNDRGKMPKSEQAAFMDETNILGNINFTIDKNWTFQQAREFLNSVGLDVVKSQKVMKVVVIRD